MSKFLTLCGFLALILLAAVGCSDDPAAPPPAQSGVQVDLVPGGADFTLKLDAVDTPDSLRHGPFHLRGYNLHYNDVIGALVVDLTITNSSPATFENPVRITFLNLLPRGTFIVGAPEGDPTFEFDFANDDLWWTPGEESLPLTVMFKADLGVSVGFNAHIFVGGVHQEGVISGRVWHDLNHDGMMDRDEPGLPGVPVGLGTGDLPPVRTLTDREGRFGFGNLEPGAYELMVLDPPPDLSSTTPINMHVLLANDMGGVSSFTQADFGFAKQENLPPGPRLVVMGSQMDRLVCFRGETVMDLGAYPGVPLEFHWQAMADPGLEIQGYRWGWDVIDPDDPQDIGWAQGEPGLGPRYQEAVWGGPLEPGQRHRLVIQCWDNERHLTRAMINFQVYAPD